MRMETSTAQSRFDSAYLANSAPWIIGEPQPAIVELEQSGWISGDVLDVGCGTGEHTIYLARRGYNVLGVDFAPHAIEHARANAARQQVPAQFELANALQLGQAARYDTVVDSALFHVFGPEDQATYTRSLHASCRPGAVVHVLALSDAAPGFGPQISDSAIRAAFRDGWELEDLEPSQYRAVVPPDHGPRLGLEVGKPADLPAWLARARRV